MGSVIRSLRRNRIVTLLAVIFFIYVGITVVRQELKLRQLHMEEAVAEENITVLKKEVEALEEELEDASSLETIERIAREKLKMVKPNEITYIIQELDEADSTISEVSD